MGISTPFKAEKGLDIVTGNLTQPKGSDVASTAALPWSTTGNFRDVTGTTAITSLATSGKVGSSQTLQFDASLTLTHNATDLILPGGSDITTAAGDVFTFLEYASGDWVCTSYILASGEAIVGGGGTTYSLKTGAYTAVANDYIYANTTSAAFTVTLPATPSAGDVVTIADYGGVFSSNNLTVARNGSTIEGNTEDKVLTYSNHEFTFFYDGTTWKLFTETLLPNVSTETYLTGPTTGNEGTTIQLTINGYSESNTYTVSVTGGTFSRNRDLITWILPTVTSNTIHTATVTIVGGATNTHDVNVINISTSTDTSISITDFTLNDSNYGWIIGASDITTYQNGAIWTSEAYEQGAVETDWKELQTEIKVTPISLKHSLRAWDPTIDVQVITSEFEEVDGASRILVRESDDTISKVDAIADKSSQQYGLLGTPRYDSVSDSIITQESAANAIAFSEDGTKYYIVGTGSDTVYQYTASPAYSVDGGTYASKSMAVGQGETLPKGLAFSSDGTKCYVVGSTNDTVYQYTLTTAWDISTGSYASKSMAVGQSETTSSGLAFSTDGTVCFVVGQGNNNVYQYTLSTAWDISTGSYSKTWTGAPTNPEDIAFSTTGQDLYIVESNNNDVKLYRLSTPWDIGTIGSELASYNQFQESSPLGIEVSSNNEKLYLVGSTNDTVYQYSCAAYLNQDEFYSNSLQTIDITIDTTPGAFFFKPDGLRMYVWGHSNDDIGDYTLTTAWDISTATATGISSQDVNVNPGGMFIRPNGIDVYVVDNQTVRTYTFTTPWVVPATMGTGPTYNASSELVTVEGQYTDIHFNNDGTKMFLAKRTDGIFRYSLSTAWDVSTASYDSNSFTSNTALFTSFTMSKDGRLLYWGLSGNGFTVNASIYLYELSTPWDLSTIGSLLTTFYLSGGLNGRAYGLHIAEDGYSLYVVIGNGDDDLERFYFPSKDLNWHHTALKDYSSLNLTAAPTEVYADLNPTIRAITATTEDLLHTDETQLAVYGATTTSFKVAMDNNADPIFTVNDSITVREYTAPLADDIYQDAYYTGAAFSTATEDLTPCGVNFNPQGTKMYIVGRSGDTIEEYTLSPAWTINSAVATNSLSISSQDLDPYGLTFARDGTKMFMLGYANDNIYEYDLSVPWDLSSAAYASKTLSVGGQDTIPTGLASSEDGTKMYVIGTNNTVYQYTLTTPWDLDSGSYSTKSFSVSSEDTVAQDITFSNDGKKMYMVGATGQDVNQYTLTTAWDVSSASFDSKTFSIATEETSPTGLAISTDGERIYVVGNAGDEVLEYQLPSPWDISMVVEIAIGTEETSVKDVTFSIDGMKCYIIGSTNNTVYQYDLTKAWDLSTASYASKSMAVGQSELTSTGLFFRDDGSSCYVVGQTNDTVYQYNLTTDWDISTGSYASKSMAVGQSELTPVGVSFSSDGTKCYVVGSNNDTVYQYTLSTAWDISTGSYASKSMSVTSEETVPTGLTFSLDGKSCYIVGTNTTDVHQYNLTTAWDISTGSYASKQGSPNVSSPNGIFLSAMGDAMYTTKAGADDKMYQFPIKNDGWTETNTLVSSVSVSSGVTTVGHGSLTNAAGYVILNDRSIGYTPTSYTWDTGEIIAKSDQIVLPSSQRFLQFKVLGDDFDKIEDGVDNNVVSNAKINLWKL
jgi:sugar lactone lactonase YvrE